MNILLLIIFNKLLLLMEKDCRDCYILLFKRCKDNVTHPKFFNLKSNHIYLQDSLKKFVNDRRNA